MTTYISFFFCVLMLFGCAIGKGRKSGAEEKSIEECQHVEKLIDSYVEAPLKARIRLVTGHVTLGDGSGFDYTGVCGELIWKGEPHVFYIRCTIDNKKEDALGPNPWICPDYDVGTAMRGAYCSMIQGYCFDNVQKTIDL